MYKRQRGVDQTALQGQGLVFAVSRVEADYLAPARFDDLLTVETSLIQRTAARITVSQDVLRADRILFRAQVTIACMSDSGRPARIPPAVAQVIG